MSVPSSVRVQATAFVVTLLQAGLLEEAVSFVDWCAENLELELTQTLEEHTDA